MATTSQNNQVFKFSDPLVYPNLTDGNSLINQGDQVYFDTSANVVKPVASNANAATFAGVAGDRSWMNPYGTTLYPQGSIPVWKDGIFTFKTTAAETLEMGDAVYVGADAQTVSDQDPGSGNIIGYVWLRPGQSSITGASGTNVEVLIKALFPFTGI